MLRQRVITAAVLLIVLVAVLSASGPWPFSLLLLLFALAVLFEWWRMTLAQPAVDVNLANGHQNASTDEGGSASCHQKASTDEGGSTSWHQEASTDGGGQASEPQEASTDGGGQASARQTALTDDGLTNGHREASLSSSLKNARTAAPAGANSTTRHGGPSFLRRVVLSNASGWRLVWRMCTSLFAVWLFVRLLLDYSVLGDALLELMSGASDTLGFGTPGWVFALDLLFGRLWQWALAGWLVATVYLFIARTERSPFSLMLTAFGLLAVPAACTALLAAQGRGIVYLLSLLALVWAADIGAYFVGRTIGGVKLAPRISPGKTLSGALGGVASAVVWVWLTSLWAPQDAGYTTFGADLVNAWGWGMALLLTIALAGFSIVGDLFESLLKRRAGRKDSSQLLPGHGGVYDRVDAVLPVAPIAMLLVM